MDELQGFIKFILNEQAHIPGEIVRLVEPKRLSREDGTGSDEFRVGEEFVYITTSDAFAVVRFRLGPRRYTVPPRILDIIFAVSRRPKPVPATLRGAKR